MGPSRNEQVGPPAFWARSCAERAALPPEGQDALLLGREVRLRGKGAEARVGSRACAPKDSRATTTTGARCLARRSPGGFGRLRYATASCRRRAPPTLRATAPSRQPSSHSSSRALARPTSAAGAAPGLGGYCPSLLIAATAGMLVSHDTRQQLVDTLADRSPCWVSSGSSPSICSTGWPAVLDAYRLARAPDGAPDSAFRSIGSAAGLAVILMVLVVSHVAVARPVLPDLRRPQHLDQRHRRQHADRTALGFPQLPALPDASAQHPVAGTRRDAHADAAGHAHAGAHPLALAGSRLGRGRPPQHPARRRRRGAGRLHGLPDRHDDRGQHRPGDQEDGLHQPAPRHAPTCPCPNAWAAHDVFGGSYPAKINTLYTVRAVTARPVPGHGQEPWLQGADGRPRRASTASRSTTTWRST